jgi:hypothetical protein
MGDALARLAAKVYVSPHMRGDVHVSGYFRDIRDVLSSEYGMDFDPSNVKRTDVLKAKRFKGWDDLPTVQVPTTGLKSLEKKLVSRSIEKVASGSEPFRKGYDPHILRSDDGDYVIDGHHRVAMYRARGLDWMPAKVLDLRSSGAVMKEFKQTQEMASKRYAEMQKRQKSKIVKGRELLPLIKKSGALPLSREYVEPHVRMVDGEAIYVDGYWRESDPGEPTGDCYNAAINIMLDHPDDPTYKLAQGTPMGRGPIEGLRYGHAWVEHELPATKLPEGAFEGFSEEQLKFLTTNIEVIDDTNGADLHLPREVYYAMGNIDPFEVRRYSYDEMHEHVARTGVAGPWEDSPVYGEINEYSLYD